MEFLLCIVQYLVVMVIIAAIGFLGIFCGIKMRKKKNAKEEQTK